MRCMLRLVLFMSSHVRSRLWESDVGRRTIYDINDEDARPHQSRAGQLDRELVFHSRTTVVVLKFRFRTFVLKVNSYNAEQILHKRVSVLAVVKML